MRCAICGKDSIGEVCNSCIRSEQVVYTKDWVYKEGLIVKKTESLKLSISNARISGTGVISTAASGMNAKIDNFNHYIGGALEVGSSAYNGKPAPMIHIKTPAGMERYLIFPQFPDESSLKSSLDKAKASILTGAAAAPAPTPVASATPSPEAQEKLNKLNLLKANGILSEAEYLAEKAKLGL